MDAIGQSKWGDWESVEPVLRKVRDEDDQFMASPEYKDSFAEMAGNNLRGGAHRIHSGSKIAYKAVNTREKFAKLQEVGRYLNGYVQLPREERLSEANETEFLAQVGKLPNISVKEAYTSIHLLLSLNECDDMHPDLTSLTWHKQDKVCACDWTSHVHVHVHVLLLLF